MNKLLIFLVAIAMTSCMSVQSGYLTNSAALSQANFSYVRVGMTGSSTATYIMGFGGMLRDNMVQEAKDAMMKENPLKDNQALSNVNVTWRMEASWAGLILKKKCIVTADLVEFK